MRSKSRDNRGRSGGVWPTNGERIEEEPLDFGFSFAYVTQFGGRNDWRG